ncbi:MAG: ArnT family glycosyltransferase [Planctomycetota bacterium]
MSSSLRWKSAALCVLLLVPLALRLVPIRHGLPRNYVPDTHMVRAALSMARDRDLTPPAGKYSIYPNLLPYLLLPCYAGEYALGKAAGAWNGTVEFGDHLLDHPEDAEIVARILVAVFGILTPLVVFKTARSAGLGRGAWIAAWLAGTSLLHVQLSTQERPWIPMTFFMALAVWPAARYVRDGIGGRLLLSAAAAGLAAACHQGGLPALAIPGLAWLFGPLEWKRRDLARRAGQGLLAVAVFGATAIALGYPHLVRHGIHPERVMGAEAIAEQGGMSIGGLTFISTLRWESVPRLAWTLFGYDPAIVVLGVGGLAFGLARRELRAPSIFLVLWSAFFMTNQSDHVRYLLPALVFLCWPAGLLAEDLVQRKWGTAVLAVALAFPAVQSARLAWLLTRPDTRADAEEELTSLKPGSRVAIDRHGPEVDLDRASLARLDRLRTSVGESLRAREARRKEQFDAGTLPVGEEGIDAVRVEELFEVDDRRGRIEVKKGLGALGEDPESVLRALGVTHLLLVDRRPGSRLEHRLEPVREGASAIHVFDPSSGRLRTTPEALLPTEMDFPLTALWRVERPGPWMALYELAGSR